MIKKLFDRYNSNIKFNKGGVIPLLGVSLIIFVMTLAIYYVADYVTVDYARESGLSNWDYGYTERVGKVPDAELRILNNQNPVIMEKAVKRSNIYLVKSLEPSDKIRNLVVKTDYSPIMIKINGRIVYDNQYKTARYVGNCYNSVELPSSTSEQVVEVFMKLPFSVRFEAKLSNGKSSAFAPWLGFWLGALITLTGIAGAVVFCVVSIRKKKLLRSLTLAALTAFIGAVIAVQNLPENSYLFNAPIIMNISTAFSQFVFVIGQLCVIAWLKRRKNLAAASLFAGAVSVLAIIFAFTPEFFAVSVWAATAALLASSVFMCFNAAKNVYSRTQYATPVFTVCAYYTIVTAFSGFFLFTRNLKMYLFTLSVPSFVVVGVLAYIFISDYRYKNKNSELRKETMRYGDSVDNISVFIHNMLSCKNEESFYKTAVDEVCALLRKYKESYSDVKFGLGIKTDDGYNEIINGGIEDCRYDLIEESALKADKGCLFSDTFFDYILKKGKSVYAVIHFENLKDGLDLFFDSMIEAAYCGLEIAFEKACDSLNSREIDIIFAELALNTEIDNGYSPDHLEHIGQYSYELCKKLSMSEEESSLISLASKLHDIGKIAIPKTILNKEGKLTAEEQIIVSSHSEFGYLILSAYKDDPLLDTAAQIARYHHERFDGSGSNGLAGEDIPICARITTICDVYDALVSKRAYKQEWSVDRVLNYIEDNSGTIFDPELIKPFKEIVLGK